MNKDLRPAAILPAAALVSAAFLVAACSGDGTTDPPGTVPYDWSLDIDLAGDASFQSLRRDTAVIGDFDYQGPITGKVNGYDTALSADSIDFLNVEYTDFHVRAALSPDGAFTFDDHDLLGDLDGSMTIQIWLKGRKADRPPSPDTLTLELGRILEYARP